MPELSFPAEEPELSFLKTRDVKDPARNPGDNGIDFYVPEFSESYLSDVKAQNNGRIKCITGADGEKVLVIRPHRDILLPVGLHAKFGSGIALIITEKSGISTGRKLAVGAKDIDSRYQGEIKVHLYNFSDSSTYIPFGKKIVQAVPHYVYSGGITVCAGTPESFYGGKTGRGSGGFGSTGLD